MTAGHSFDRSENIAVVSKAFRPSIAVLAVCIVLSAFISVMITARRGEFGPRYYDIIVNNESETASLALLHANPNIHPIYKQFIEKYISSGLTGGMAMYDIPSKMGVPFFKIVVFYTLLFHFLFGFGFSCIIYGLFRDPKVAIASVFLVYSIQPLRQIYSCHPWEANEAMAIVPLIFASFGLLMLNKRWLSLSIILLVALVHFTWFIPVFPIYLALFFHKGLYGEDRKYAGVRKAMPLLLFFYPIAITLAMHFKMTAGLHFSREDWIIFWNLVVMRSNHSLLFYGVEGYYLLFGFLSMTLACPILMRLPSAKKLPYLQTMTYSLFYLSMGYFIVQIFGNELHLSVAANATVPLRLEIFLFYLMVFHLFAGVMDRDAPAASRVFALFMFVIFLFAWRLIFSYFPICMPVWALLQARLDRAESFSSRKNLLQIALALLVFGFINFRCMLPTKIAPKIFNIWTYFPSLNVKFLAPITQFLVMNLLFVFLVFALLSALSLVFRRLKHALPDYRRGMQSAVFSLAILALGGWWLLHPHNNVLVSLPLSEVPNELSRFIEGRPAGPETWRKAIDWINTNIDKNDIIFVHPDIRLSLLTTHKISMDWGVTNYFFFVPSLFKDIDKELREIYRIQTRHSNVRYHAMLYPNMMSLYPLARVKAYFNAFPERHYEWIIEPASAPEFLYNDNKVIQKVEPVFKNDSIRIYKARPNLSHIENLGR